MNNKALALLFYRELEKIEALAELDSKAKTLEYYRLLQLLFAEATKQEQVQFSTLFARIAYACHKFQLEKSLQYYIHAFRKAIRLLQRTSDSLPDSSIEELGIKVLASSIEAIFQQPIPDALAEVIPSKWSWKSSPAEIKAFIPTSRVLALQDEPTPKQLLIRDSQYPDAALRLQYDIPDRNENFNATLEVMRDQWNWPIQLNLIDVEVDAQGVYRPKAFVVEPDYLVDVSAIAECFRDTGPEPVVYLLKKFLPFQTTKYLMIGNIANFFLDELMNNPEGTFKEIFPKVFQLNPLAFCLFEDREIREIMQTAQKHFVNLKRMILQELPQQGIDPQACFLEPSFYSERYGIQGRLDIFYRNPNGGKQSAIIELKSGKAYRPNLYGISSNHYIQTLLYDLLIHSVYGDELDPTNYILYSGVDEQHLRFAPAIKSQQFEAIQIRNQLVAFEQQLSELGQSESESLLIQGNTFFGQLNPARFPKMTGFTRRDLDAFTSVYQGMSALERRYFTAFSGFIAREQYLAKTGIQGVDRLNGLASLWIDSLEDKLDNFDVLNHLTIIDQHIQEDDPLLVFAKTNQTSSLANFRQGDIGVLYPHLEEDQAVLSNQVFKCTIVTLDEKQVTVRLRAKQYNISLFEEMTFWNIEHDLLDSGFTGMYRSLYTFAQGPQRKRDLLLGLEAPKEVSLIPELEWPKLTEKQQDILKRMLASQEYFLLWGPPGTGKTSVMLHYAVKYLLEHTQENILLLAYTNRAVDEICESIEQIGDHIKDHYFRVGSRYSTGAAYRPQLLYNKIKDVPKRKDVRAIIDRHRIVVSTVASIVNKPELLHLKQFQTAIIDEASQILEPLLAGLLPSFNRFVLIGDHKQLPAVVTQNEEQSKVFDTDLHQIGLKDMRHSLFERLFKRCQSKGWDWAYAQLSQQGRMHAHIMDFPNQHFYEKTLEILPENLPVHLKQVKSIDFQVPVTSENEIVGRICSNRVVFISTPVDTLSTQKTNIHEAKQIAELVQTFKELYQQENRAFSSRSIGIITPYRAQIAQIREVLMEQKLPADEITIDTVERYQGGARDIILISLCTNSLFQIQQLSVLSEEGVDRKLNVAMTRAREHLVVLGNANLLRESPVYRNLLDYCLGEEKTSS